jgi:hypothetical protein
MKLVIYRDNNITLVGSVFHIDGFPVNLIGCQIVMAFKTDQSLPNTASTIIKGTTAPYSGIVIRDTPTNMFNVALVTADTQGLPNTIEVFTDILITDRFGNPLTVANLTTVEIKANITRR